MKKVILVLAALVLVVSGVAAVSAYEAHLINVKAHVENALEVDTTEVDFGTVFPEEWLVAHRDVSLSDSAIGELGSAVGDLEDVTFQIYAEWKPVPVDVQVANPVEDAAGNLYYEWMGYFLYTGWDVDGSADNMDLVGPPSGDPPSAVVAIGDPIVFGDDIVHNLYIGIDVPVFEGYYNPWTDPEPKPSGLLDPTWIIPADFPGFDPHGMDFGLDLKIQVIDIDRVIPAP